VVKPFDGQRVRMLVHDAEASRESELRTIPP
jgi:hypothetical protein